VFEPVDFCLNRGCCCWFARARTPQIDFERIDFFAEKQSVDEFHGRAAFRKIGVPKRPAQVASAAPMPI
jgi:hypothetical protein